MGTALDFFKEGDPLNLRGKSLAIVIYWHPRKTPDALANGHAALIIDYDSWRAKGSLALMDKDWYVSWVGGKIDWHPALGSKGGNKGICNSIVEDMEDWGGQASGKQYQGKDLYVPTRWVAIQGLRYVEMWAAWEAAREKKTLAGQTPHWRLLDKNCATMVSTILKAGGGDRLATAHKHQLVWWPTDLIRYARSMTGHVYKSSNDPAAAFL